MKKAPLFFIFSLMVVSVMGQRGYLLGGSGWDKIALLNKKSGKVDWIHALNKGEECNCVAMVGRDKILYAYKKGARLVSRNHEIIWDYKAEGGELHNASVLEDGGYLLGVCGNPARIIELDNQGRFRKDVKFETGIIDFHSQFRQIKKSRRGTYLIPLMGRGIVVEMDDSAKVIREYPVEGNPFSVYELDDDNLLVSCGDAHCFVKIERQSGRILERVGQTTITGIELQYVAEVLPLKNGHKLICSWDGHSKTKETPSLIETDKDNRLVWKLAYRPDIKAVSAVFPY